MIKWEPYPYTGRPVLYASIRSKNGANGSAWISRKMGGRGFELTAASETTGHKWEAPMETFWNIEDAKAAAEKLWKGV